MLIDPLVLKKKLNRMATEQGAFAVLSSLLLYVAELAACDPQLRSKRTKWAEGKENQVSCKQSSPDSNRGCYPTRFQLLRSRFLNNNREPYVKKRREVGKLVIKERLWVNRAGNKSERRGDGKATEEGEDVAPSERVRWGSVSGKNTVKNILKKFLAAEEKEDKEKIPSWKKKGPNSSLPKIVNRSSVLSRLKEQFEQSSLCSATEVKASVLRKGGKKTKTFPSRKAIRKPEVRVLRTAALAATDINNPESQYLVCSMVPVPRLSMATEINHPWSWSKTNATMQPCDHNTGLKEKGNSERKHGENETSHAAQDVEGKEKTVAPKEMPGSKDSAESNTDSTKQIPHFKPSLDSSFSICKNKALGDCISLSSEDHLDCDRNNMSAGPDTSSLMRNTKAVQHVKDDSPPSDVPYSSTAEGFSEPSSQDINADEIPKIIMHVYSLEEVDPELTEPEKDPSFAGQKYFSERKGLEDTLPFHSLGVQALYEVEPPRQDPHLSHITQTARKRPAAVQKEVPGLRDRGSKEDKEGEKYHSEDKMYSTYSENYSNIPATKEQENETPNCQMQNEPQTKQSQPPQMPSPQYHFSNSSAEISNPDANQTKPAPSSSDFQEQKPGAAEEHVPSDSDWDKKEGPLPEEFVKHKFYFVDEDLGKDRFLSSNEMMSPSNNGALNRSTFTDLETCHKQSNNFIECEETTADEVPWPDSEVQLSPSSHPVMMPMSGILGQRIHYTSGSHPALPPAGQVTPGAAGVDGEYASHGSEKHPPPSSDESAVHENNAAAEKKTACDFNKQPLSPDHATENEYSTAEETITCQSLENCLPFSTKKIEKHANKTVLARKPLLPLEKNQTLISDDTLKQGSDVLEESLFPSSELVSGQKKCAKGTDNVSKGEKHKPLSSDDAMKHGNDRTETEEREKIDVLYRSEQEQVSASRDVMDHDNSSSNEKNTCSPQTSCLLPSEHDTNVQGVKSTGEGLKCLTPSRDFIKREHDRTVDGNICCNNEKHQLSRSNEPMRQANDTAGRRNIKLNFKDYSVPPRNTARHDDKTTDEDNTFRDMKDNTVQHEKNYEGEGNTSKNQTPSSSPLVKRDKKSFPLDTRQQTSSGDFVKPETKLAEKKTNHTSEKPQSPSSNTVEKPQERSFSAEKKQKAQEVEDVRSPETKAVTGDDEHQCWGQHQLPLKSKSAKPGKNIPGGEKQQTRSEDFAMPDSNAKEKKKFLRPRKYRSVSSETAVLPQEKHSPDQKQQASATAGFKKPETNVVREKDEDPNCEKLPTPSSNKGMNFKEKKISGERKQKTSVAGDVRPARTKAAKEDDEHQHSRNQQLPFSSKSTTPGKKTPGEEKQETVTEGLRKPETNAVKDKSKGPGSGMCRSSSPDLLWKLQEKNVTAKKKASSPPSDKKIMDRTGSTEKRSGPWGEEKYQQRPSDQIGKHSMDRSGKEGSESYQTALSSGGVESKSSSVPKESNLSKTEKSSKSSPSRDASKYDKSTTENRKKQPGFKKYRALSSQGLVKDQRGTAGREAGWEAAGTQSDRKAELGDCSKTAPLSKYTAESYSEGPLDSSFKPLIIRVSDTFKHHS